MRSITDILGASLPTKVGVTAAAIVIMGGGAAIAAPGLGTPAADPAEMQLLEVHAADFMAAFEASCEEDPDTSSCSGPSDDDRVNLGDDDSDDDSDEGELEDSGDEVVADTVDEVGEGAEAFSAWVRSLPTDWGCIRGHLVSHVAQTGPHHDDFEDWIFDSAEAAAGFLGLEGRCVEVALARSGGDPDGDPDLSEMESASVDGADTERPAHAGKPNHAGKPEQAGKPSGAGQSGAKGSNGRGRGR